MIPVEDFTGPTISEIQKFIEITDEARKEGEVSVVAALMLMLVIIVVACRQLLCTAPRVGVVQG